MKKRILAIICIALLILLYLATLVAAIVNPDGNGQVFRGLLALCVAVPILLWMFTYLHKLMMDKKTDNTSTDEMTFDEPTKD